MSVKQITDSDLRNIGVIGMEDAPGLPKDEMQRKLEETAREVIIPRLNMLISEFSNMVEEINSLAVESGNVTIEDREYWSGKADMKHCIAGSSAGWYKVGTITLGAGIAYSAVMVVRSFPADAESKAGTVRLSLRANDSASSLEQAVIQWVSPSDYDIDRIRVDFADGAAQLWVRADEGEFIHLQIISESNAEGYDALMELSSSDTPAEAEPEGFSGELIGGCVRTETDTMQSFTAADNSYLVCTALAHTLIVTCTSGNAYGCMMRITFAEGGSVSFSGCTHLDGDDITAAAAGQTWELSILDGSVIARKLTAI